MQQNLYSISHPLGTVIGYEGVLTVTTQLINFVSHHASGSCQQ